MSETLTTDSRQADDAWRGSAPLHPVNRIPASQRKIRPPFVLDPTMCFYSPQANLDALTHPRVAAWLSFVEHDWTPTAVPEAVARQALLLPCTKYKPYVTSREHRAINAALQADGWEPIRGFDGPTELLDILDDHEHPDVLSVAPLMRDGVVLDRFVISEPLALVPYEHSLYHAGEQSPATSYDDPGLFENRGTSVSPERSDCTATQRSNGSWSWGPAERQAYAEMHNAMAGTIGRALKRLRPHYMAVTAWVSPGLTHRSFIADSTFRIAEGLHLARRGTHGDIRLIGALDDDPNLAVILPHREQITRATENLVRRLDEEGRNSQPDSARAIYARGDGHDTPLGLPELTAELCAYLRTESIRL